MLGKLLKYEIPSVGRKLGPLFIAWAAASVFLGISIRGFDDANFILVLSILFYIAVTVAIFVMMTILIIQKYSKSMLGDEAYFNLVLPVTVNQHLANKIISAFVWIMISTLAAFVSGFLILLLSGGLSELMKSAGWEEFNTALALMGIREAGIIIEYVILCLFSSIKSILAIYAAITIGHQAKERIVLASIGAYIALLVFESFVGNIFVMTGLVGKWGWMNMATSTATVEINDIVNPQLFLIIGTIMEIGFSVAYYFVCKYLMEKKLNLN